MRPRIPQPSISNSPNGDSPIGIGAVLTPSRMKCYDLAPQPPKPEPNPNDPSGFSHVGIGIYPPQIVCYEDEPEPQSSDK